MRHILCFGDSNTWGYIPGSLGDRLPFPQRLAGVIQNALGDVYRVIEEGLNGRTTAFEDPLNDDRCGKKHLPMLLQSHAPIDLINVMLGTNGSLKHHLNLAAEDVALGMAALIDMIETSGAGLNGIPPKILLVCPAPMSSERPYAPKFDGALEKSKKLARL